MCPIELKASARKSKTNVGTISENYLPRRNNSHGTKILEDRESWLTPNDLNLPIDVAHICLSKALDKRPQNHLPSMSSDIAFEGNLLM